MAKRSHPTRSDTFRVTLMVDGTETGIWDKKTGGELDSDELKYSPGGMLPQLSLGGKVNPGNVTLQREYDRVDDHDKINFLLNRVGKARTTVSQRPLDFDGNPYGKAVLWHGTLKRVQVPDVDSEGNSAALIEVEISTDGKPNAA